MARRTRLFLIVLLLAGLAPGLWWRMPLPPLRHDAPVAVTPIAGLPDSAGEMEVVGGWELASPNEHFGGFSALALLGNGRLLAASDKARFLTIALPPGETIPAASLGYFRPAGGQDKRLSDLESLARDPASGTLWAAYEYSNTIERIGADLGRVTERLRGTQGWPRKSGAEAIEHLPDGRFLVIGESRGGNGGSPALLFAGDPLDPVRDDEGPIAFRFAALEGYSPTGAAALPDGRVLVLVRSWQFALPPRFTGAIVLADPRNIRAGKVWRGKVLARLEPPLPSDNYEGIAVAPGPDGSVAVWLISDDNFMRSQRTLLLKLRWENRPRLRK